MTGTITCPACGHAAAETVPVDRCVIVYECVGCKTVLKPKAGDCCVFCSYSDARCPSSPPPTHAIRKVGKQRVKAIA